LDAATLYPAVKLLHVISVALSIAGFIARGLLSLAGSPLLSRSVVRVAPHVVDTVLLGSAIWLAWFLGQVPFVHAWITAKVVVVVAYIALGMVALNGKRSRRVRGVAFAAALCAAAYVIAVALTRSVIPWR